MDSDQDIPGSSPLVERPHAGSSTARERLKVPTEREKKFKQLEDQVGRAGDTQTIDSIHRLISKYIEPTRRTQKKEKHQGINFEDDEEAIALQLQEVTDNEEARWVSTLDDFDTFNGHIIEEKKMSEIVAGLRENGTVRCLGFEKCTISRHAYHGLLYGRLEAEVVMKIYILSFSGMILDAESLHIIGRLFTSYSCKFLELTECDLTTASLQDLHEGLSAEGLVDLSKKEAVEKKRVHLKATLNLRGNPLLVADEAAPGVLKRMMSACKFEALLTDSYIITMSKDKKAVNLILLPDVYGVEMSYWIELIKVFNVQHITMHTFHNLLKKGDRLTSSLNETGQRLKSLTVPVTALRVQKMIRAVAKLTVGLHVEDLRMSGKSSSPSLKCVEVLRDYFIKRRFKLRSLSFRKLETAHGCGQVISDLIRQCLLGKFEMSVLLLPMLLPELQKLWDRHFQKVPELVLEWRKPIVFGMSSSSSSESENLQEVLSIHGSSSSLVISSSVSSEEEAPVSMLCTNVMDALHLVSKRMTIKAAKRGGNHIQERVYKKLKDNDHYVARIDKDDLIIDVKDGSKSGQLGWFREVAAKTRHGLGTCGMINFVGVSLSPKDLHELGGLLRFCDFLTKVTLDSCGLNDIDVQDLTVGLARNKEKLLLLDLKGNSGLGEVSARSVASLIVMRHVKRVRLVECHLERWHDHIMMPAIVNNHEQAGTAIEYAENKVNIVLDVQRTTVEFAGRECIVEFPPNSVVEKTSISLLLNKPESTDNLVPVTSMLQCFPTGTTFTAPIRVKLLPWVSPTSTNQENGSLIFQVLKRENADAPWVSERVPEYRKGDFVEFDTLHFSDYEVVVEEHQLPLLEANYCNILFVPENPQPHSATQTVVSWFIPNSPARKELLRNERLLEGLRPDQGSESPLCITAEDHITVSITQDEEQRNDMLTTIRPSNPAGLIGSDIIRDGGKKAKFLVKLTNHAPCEEEKNADLSHTITRTSGANVQDTFILTWRPPSQVLQIQPHNHYTTISVTNNQYNQINVIADEIEKIDISQLTESIAPPLLQGEEDTQQEAEHGQEDIHQDLTTEESEEAASSDSSSDDT